MMIEEHRKQYNGREGWRVEWQRACPGTEQKTHTHTHIHMRMHTKTH